LPYAAEAVFGGIVLAIPAQRRQRRLASCDSVRKEVLHLFLADSRSLPMLQIRWPPEPKGGNMIPKRQDKALVRAIRMTTFLAKNPLEEARAIVAVCIIEEHRSKP